jgi:hypothetical protein
MREWPSAFFDRMSVFNLPLVHQIRPINRKKENFIILWVDETFHIHDNMALSVALFLAQKLDIPIIALVSLIYSIAIYLLL